MYPPNFPKAALPFILSLLFLATTSCNKKSPTEPSNTGQVVVQLTSDSATPYADVALDTGGSCHVLRGQSHTFTGVPLGDHHFTYGGACASAYSGYGGAFHLYNAGETATIVFTSSSCLNPITNWGT